MDILSIIRRIDMRIAEVGMSKAEFYRKSGISSASYSQWNTGKYSPRKKTLENAASCIGVSYEYLVTGFDKKEKPTPVSEDGPKEEITSIFAELSVDNRSKLLELSRLYLDAQRKNEEKE